MSKLSDHKKLDIIKEALKDWNSWDLSSEATLLVINNVVSKERSISPKTLAKVRELIERDRKEKKYGQKS